MLPRVTRVMSQNAGCFLWNVWNTSPWSPESPTCGIAVVVSIIDFSSAAVGRLPPFASWARYGKALRIFATSLGATQPFRGQAELCLALFESKMLYTTCCVTRHDTIDMRVIVSVKRRFFSVRLLKKTMWRSFPPQREMPQQRVEGVNLPLSRQEILPKTSQPKSLNLP